MTEQERPTRVDDAAVARAAVEAVWLAAAVADPASSGPASELSGLASRRWAGQTASGAARGPGLSAAHRRTIRRHLRAAAAAVDGTTARPDPEETLQAALASGSEFVRILHELAAADDGLAALLGQGLEMLDVGTGAAGLASQVALDFPNARVHAIDVDAQILDLADHVIRQRGVSDRVVMTRQDVLDLDAAGRFDLIWIPLGELHETAAMPGLRAVADALRGGGRVIAPYVHPADPEDVLGLARTWRLAVDERCRWGRAEVLSAAARVGLEPTAESSSASTGVMCLRSRVR